MAVNVGVGSITANAIPLGKRCVRPGQVHDELEATVRSQISWLGPLSDLGIRVLDNQGVEIVAERGLDIIGLFASIPDIRNGGLECHIRGQSPGLSDSGAADENVNSRRSALQRGVIPSESNIVADLEERCRHEGRGGLGHADTTSRVIRCECFAFILLVIVIVIIVVVALRVCGFRLPSCPCGSLGSSLNLCSVEVCCPDLFSGSRRCRLGVSLRLPGRRGRFGWFFYLMLVSEQRGREIQCEHTSSFVGPNDKTFGARVLPRPCRRQGSKGRQASGQLQNSSSGTHIGRGNRSDRLIPV